MTRQLNTFNRKIRLFFDAVQDKDNMLYFPEANVGKEQAQLNRSLNRLNDLLARTKGESHKQEHFYQSLLEEVPSGVLAWDDSGRIIIANSAAFSLLKCNRLYTETQLAQLLNVTGIRKSLSISEKMCIRDSNSSLVRTKNRLVLFAPSTLRIPTSFKRDKVENRVTIHNPRQATNTASNEALANIQPKLRSDLYRNSLKSFKKK